MFAFMLPWWATTMMPGEWPSPGMKHDGCSASVGASTISHVHFGGLCIVSAQVYPQALDVQAAVFGTTMKIATVREPGF
jgi:hypothetical protein